MPYCNPKTGKVEKLKINTEKPAALGKNLNRGRGNAATKGIVEKDGSIVESPVAIDFEAEASSQDDVEKGELEAQASL